MDVNSRETVVAKPSADIAASRTKSFSPLSKQNSTSLSESSQSSLSSTTNNIAVPPTKSPLGLLNIQIRKARDLSVNPEDSQVHIIATFENSQFIGQETSQANSKASSVVAIPRSRQPSFVYHNSLTPASLYDNEASIEAPDRSNPKWNYEFSFEVTDLKSDLQVFVYDSTQEPNFIGQTRIRPLFVHEQIDRNWYQLVSEDIQTSAGEIEVELLYEKYERKHYTPDDFEILRLIGKGTFGQVYQVRKRDNNNIYAMKILSKKVIVQKKEVAHTICERNILVRTTLTDSPFIVSLKYSFQTPSNLYLVTDYMSGGELFWHLQNEGRFTEARAKFYIAELLLALEHLHNNDIVYRDLKPENILLDADGHIALCDFGLSKSNLASDSTTNTFCGTTEYLAPEVLLDESGYTKLVDFWSLGVLVFEMCCGWSPFHAEDTQQMYKNIAFGRVRFPKDVLSAEGRHLVKSLLNRNPKHRLGAQRDALEIRVHPFFLDIDWDALYHKRVTPPFRPNSTGLHDVSNFDTEFTSVPVSKLNPFQASTPLSSTVQEKFQGFTFVGAPSYIENNLASNRPNGNDLDMQDSDQEKSEDNETFDLPENSKLHANDSYDEVFQGHFE